MRLRLGLGLLAAALLGALAWCWTHPPGPPPLTHRVLKVQRSLNGTVVIDVEVKGFSEPLEQIGVEPSLDGKPCALVRDPQPLQDANRRLVSVCFQVRTDPLPPERHGKALLQARIGSLSADRSRLLWSRELQIPVEIP